jgi:hypothetical protein
MKLNLFLLSAATMVNAATAAEPIVDLGTAESYTILAKSGISTVPASVITGNIAVSPIAADAITGFDLTPITGTTQSSTDTTAQVVPGGLVYASNHASPTPGKLGIAVKDMETAYIDAAGRANTDGARIDLGAGLIGGLTLTPGVYTFSSGVNIATDIYLDGAGVYIIQVAGDLLQAADKEVILLHSGSDQATADKIFWQVAGAVTVGAGAKMEGIILTKTAATFETGSTLNGRILAQTAVALQSVTVTPVYST